MTILRWIMLTALLVAFLLLSVANWTPVPFRLPDGAVISLRLPLLLGAAFVAGWLPTWLYHLGVMANFKRKARTGRIDTVPGASKLPSQAQPTIVPPAGA
jgi:uncharacterized integral membrane protein